MDHACLLVRFRPLADIRGWLIASRLQSFVRVAIQSTMFIERSYAERESLSDRDLDRLRTSLIYQVQRYEDAIRGYSPEKMEKYGKPFLAGLLQKVADVDATITARGSGG